jgi:hypothetical protein
VLSQLRMNLVEGRQDSRPTLRSSGRDPYAARPDLTSARPAC